MNPTTKPAKNWLNRITSKIRITVRRERSMGMPIQLLTKHHLATMDEQGAVNIIADRAGVDWLYNESTGEVRFFEGN